jgi:hypothetical protein
MTLMAAVKEFKLQHKHEWATQKGALYMCDTASPMFVKFLREAGLADLVHAKTYSFFVGKRVAQPCTGCAYENGVCRIDCEDRHHNPDPSIFITGSNEMGSSRADWHQIVETDDFYIDWTARQYVENAPFPHIIPKRYQMRLPFDAAPEEKALAAHA